MKIRNQNTLKTLNTSLKTKALIIILDFYLQRATMKHSRNGSKVWTKYEWIELFAKCRYFMSIKAAEIVFKSFLLRIVEHGALFLSLCSDSVVKKVQSHINRLLRIVYKPPPRTANRDLYTRSRVLPSTLRADASLLRLAWGRLMTEWMLQPDMFDGSIE